MRPLDHHIVLSWRKAAAAMLLHDCFYLALHTYATSNVRNTSPGWRVRHTRIRQFPDGCCLERTETSGFLLGRRTTKPLELTISIHLLNPVINGKIQKL